MSAQRQLQASWAVRLLVLLGAVIVAGWFALGARQAHETASAAAILLGPGQPSAEKASNARSLLEAAAALNPDVQVRVLRAELIAEQGDLRQADRLLLAVTRDEPSNLAAWVELEHFAADPKISSLAFGHIIGLVPQVHAAP